MMEGKHGTQLLLSQFKVALAASAFLASELGATAILRCKDYAPAAEVPL